MPLSGKELIRKLKQSGWTLVRIKGSHHIMKRGSREVSIPVHGNRPLGKGLERRILKVTELQKDES